MTKRTTVAKAIEDQRQWIEYCGGDLAGYIRRYGVIGEYKTVDHNGKEYECPSWYGNGGRAIYNADVAELNRLIGLKKDKRRKYL